MATIQSFRTALETPRSHFSTLAGLSRMDESVMRSTYFAEAKVRCGGRNMMIYMPLSASSLRRVERFIPLKRHLVSAIVPQLTILREEMRWVDALGREMACDILCEPLPAGLPFADAVASIADEQEATQLIDALDELQANLQSAGISHNNIREENILVDEDYHLHLVRWYYATDGVGGDDETFAALHTKIASRLDGMVVHDADLDSYCAATPLTGHLSVRFMREGLAAVEHDTGWGFVDSDNNIVIEPKYEWVSDFCEGRAEVQTPQGMGLINRHGEYIIEPRYKVVDYDVVSGNSQVLGDEGWMVFNYEGERLEELEDWDDEMANYPPPERMQNNLIYNKITIKQRELWNRQNVLLSVADLRVLPLQFTPRVLTSRPSCMRVSSPEDSSPQPPRLKTSPAIPRVSAVRR